MNDTPSSTTDTSPTPTPVTIGIEISSNAPQELLDRVIAMSQDLDDAGVDVTLEMIRSCRVCGCTDERACFGGCYWVDEEDDICSACAPTPGGVPNPAFPLSIVVDEYHPIRRSDSAALDQLMRTLRHRDDRSRPRPMLHRVEDLDDPATSAEGSDA